jgi:glyceraldehyde 3-phosphate dehydrogenase
VKKRVAINGFGRIGRLVLRSFLSSQNFDVVLINDRVPPDNLAYLFKYDTVHGTYSGDVQSGSNYIQIDGRKIPVLNESNPALLPLNGVDFVVESTGKFTTKAEAEKHLIAGARRVIITAPAKDVPTYVYGVNHLNFNPEQDSIFCNASCTTNALAVLCKVLLDEFGIEEGLMTTVHSMTASQPSVDGPSAKDWRGGRAASQNIIPSSTGAAKAVTLCLPELKGKLTGMAFRVPTIDVSAIDLTVKLMRDTSYEEICQKIEEASNTKYKGIIGITNEQLVSSDCIGSKYSCIVDQLSGIALNSRFFKLVAWYDNEAGYSQRVVDLLEYISLVEPK